MTHSVNFDFCRADGQQVSGSFNLVPISYPVVHGHYMVDGEPMTLTASTTQSIVENYYKVELNNSTTNDWYIYPAGIYPYGAANIYSGSYSTGSLCQVAFSLSNHVLNTSSVNSVIIKPVNPNIGFNNCFVTEEALSFTPVNGNFSCSLVPQAYHVTLKGDKKNTKFNILVPASSSAPAEELIVTTNSVASTINITNQALFAYTAEASDARYLVIDNSGSAVSSSYAKTASWATNASTASFWNSSSLVSLINTKQDTLVSGNTYSITASNARTASYINGNLANSTFNNIYGTSVSAPIMLTDILSFANAADLTLTAEEMAKDVIVGVGGFEVVGANYGYKMFDLNGETGETIISGSLKVSQGVTASLQGTASWATNALTSSFITASNIFGTVASASFASTASYVNASQVTASNALIKNSLQIGEGSSTNTIITPSSGLVQFSNRVSADTFVGLGGGMTGKFSGSFHGTASWATNALTSSFVAGSNVIGTVNSASYALTSSVLSGVLPVSKGGTGLQSVSVNHIPFGNGTNSLITSSNFVYDKDNNKLILSGSLVAQTIGNVPGTLNFAANYTHFDYFYYACDFSVWAYKDTLGGRVFSPSANTAQFPGDGYSYGIDISWTAVSGATGYIVYCNQSNTYIDVSTNQATFGNNGQDFWPNSTGTGLPTVTPTLVYANETALDIKGMLNAGGLSLGSPLSVQMGGTGETSFDGHAIVYGQDNLLVSSSLLKFGEPSPVWSRNESLVLNGSQDYNGYRLLGFADNIGGGLIRTHPQIIEFGLNTNQVAPDLTRNSASIGGSFRYDLRGGFAYWYMIRQPAGGNDAYYDIQLDNNGRCSIVGDNTTAPPDTSSFGARLAVIDTTEQLRVGYNISNYYSTTVDSEGKVTLDAVGDGAKFKFNDIVNIPTKTPSSATDTGETGDIGWDSNYIYVCTATDTWKRAALSTW